MEVHKTLKNIDSAMSYSINIDPKYALVSFFDGATATLGDSGATQLPATGLSYAKFNTFSALFNQYRVNSITIKIRVDLACGLENAVIVSNDKGTLTPVSSMASAISGAHKSYSMTSSRRELTYTIKNTGQDKDYLGTGAEQQIPSERRYIKVFQKLPKDAAETAKCEHQVSVLVNCTLKDSKNLN